MWEARTVRRKKKGSPSKSWDEKMKILMTRRDLKWNQDEIMAQDRTICRAVVE